MEDIRSYKIYEVNMQYLEEKVAKLNKKAQKLNCEPMKLEILNTEMIDNEDGYFDKVYEVTITGKPPIINGWAFVGTIEHREHGNVIRAIAGETFPESYREFDGTCEHCKVKRFRKETYLVKNIETGEFKAVGKSCLKDFLGHNNPNSYASLMENLADLDWLEEFEGIPVGHGESYIPLKPYLAYVALEIKNHGWKSRTIARELNSVATADLALFNMYNTDPEEKEEYASQDMELACKAIEWARDLEPNNDYLNNIHIITLDGFTSVKNIGFSASIVSSYTKHIEREIEKEQRETAKKKELISEYVGTVGQKIQTELTLMNEFGFETQWGYTTVYKFSDQDGNIFIWKSSNNLDMKQGNVYKLKGTIKDHSEYNQVKQTVLTRCKIIA